MFEAAKLNMAGPAVHVKFVKNYIVRKKLVDKIFTNGVCWKNCISHGQVIPNRTHHNYSTFIKEFSRDWISFQKDGCHGK